MNPQAFPMLVARVLLALMFLLAGISKFGGLEGTAGYIASKGLPMAQLLAFATAALEVGAAFTLMASCIFHNYWSLPADKQMVDQLMFMKNIAIVGGLLAVFAFGPGTLSLDERRAGA
jgi:putative oxidoreductase